MLSHKYPSFTHLLQAIGVDEGTLIAKAVELKWLVRTPRKITLIDLLEAIYQGVSQGSPSYNDIASTLDVKNENSPSRQAVAKRINKGCRELFKWLIQEALKHKLQASGSSPP